MSYSLFAVGMVAAGAGGKRRSKLGTTSALLSMSRQTPSIAPTMRIGRAPVQLTTGQMHALAGAGVDFVVRAQASLSGTSSRADLDGKQTPQQREIQNRSLRSALARSQVNWVVPNVHGLRLASGL